MILLPFRPTLARKLNRMTRSFLYPASTSYTQTPFNLKGRSRHHNAHPSYTNHPGSLPLSGPHLKERTYRAGKKNLRPIPQVDIDHPAGFVIVFPLSSLSHLSPLRSPHLCFPVRVRLGHPLFLLLAPSSLSFGSIPSISPIALLRHSQPSLDLENSDLD